MGAMTVHFMVDGNEVPNAGNVDFSDFNEIPGPPTYTIGATFAEARVSPSAGYEFVSPTYGIGWTYSPIARESPQASISPLTGQFRFEVGYTWYIDDPPPGFYPDTHPSEVHLYINLRLKEPPQDDFTITTETARGRGTTTGDGLYHKNDLCTVSATPEDGYEFVKWVDNHGVVVQSQVYTFPVTRNTTMSAYFKVASTGEILYSRSNGMVLYGNSGTILYK